MSEPRRHAFAPDDAPQARAPLRRRFLAYQAERFPLLGLAPLVTLFAFSSAAYSRRARGAPGFVDARVFAVGAFTAVTIFFLLRVLDEHKDASSDLRFRPELPVPRGLISLAELRRIAAIAAAAALLANLALAPVLLWPLAIVALWATLMTREFFVPVWLRAHPAAYLLTHMAIMPLIDGYTTGLDWLRAGAHPPHGLFLFLLVTFMNGILIEIGRKIRAPEDERTGVDTYTSAWGMRVAPSVWLLALAASATLAWRAAIFTATARPAGLVLGLALIPCAWPALGFLRLGSRSFARWIDVASQVWPAVTYLVLGALPLALVALRRS
jgi:4-hydroxybenzoate polyprenyltransferase